MSNEAKRIQSANDFRERVQALGGKQVGKYVNAHTPVDCECKYGHNCKPRPANVQSGYGICRECSGTDPKVAELKFKKHIAQINATQIGTYKNNSTPVHCICKNLHDCYPIPGDLLCYSHHKGICKICAGQDFDTCSKRFSESIIKYGGIQIEEYIGYDKPVLCLCENKHQCRVNPQYVNRYKMIPCITCSKSIGEKLVEEILNELKTTMSLEKLIPQDKVTEKPKMKYDFGNSTVKIEFDGIQHFKRNNIFSVLSRDPEKFNDQRGRDVFKTKRAIETGHTIIRIHYKTLRKGRDYIKNFLERNILSLEPKLIVTDEEDYVWLRCSLSGGCTLTELVENDLVTHFE
jgi:hypothetical protein